MSVTAEDLAIRCDWVLRRNVRLLREQGFQNADFYFAKGEGSLLHNFRLYEIAAWMNDGAHKEVIFAMLRHVVEDNAYDCFIMASDAWRFRENKLLRDLPMDRQREIMQGKNVDELVRLGYGSRVEAISVVGQTPELSQVLSRAYYRDPLDPSRVGRIGDIDSGSGALEQLAGRSKMFGPITEPGMQEIYDKVGRVYKKRVGPPPELINIATEEP